jgi:hypothetical protein
VRAALAEMVLDAPDGVEAQPVGELDLLEGLLVGLLLGLALPVGMRLGPRLGDVDLVEQVELHRSSSLRISLERTRGSDSERSIPNPGGAVKPVLGHPPATETAAASGSGPPTLPR